MVTCIKDYSEKLMKPGNVEHGYMSCKEPLKGQFMNLLKWSPSYTGDLKKLEMPALWNIYQGKLQP